MAVSVVSPALGPSRFTREAGLAPAPRIAPVHEAGDGSRRDQRQGSNGLMPHRDFVATRGLEEAAETVEGADVGAGEYLEAAQSAKQYIVRAPRSDPGLSEESVDDRVIVERFERLEFQLSCPRRLCNSQNCLCLSVAEADRPECRSSQGENFLGGREGVQIAHTRATRGGQSAQERHSCGDRELLACDGVEKALENCREARRSQAAVSLNEVAEQFVSRSPEIEIRKVDVEAEHPADESFSLRLDRVRYVVSCQNDLESRPIGGSNLSDGQCERRVVDEQCAAVADAVPSIDLILPAPSQSPGSEVKSKRRQRVQLETNFDELGRRRGRVHRLALWAVRRDGILTICRLPIRLPPMVNNLNNPELEAFDDGRSSRQPQGRPGSSSPLEDHPMGRGARAWLLAAVT